MKQPKFNAGEKVTWMHSGHQYTGIVQEDDSTSQPGVVSVIDDFWHAPWGLKEKVVSLASIPAESEGDGYHR